MQYILILLVITISTLSSAQNDSSKELSNNNTDANIKYEARRDSILLQTDYGSIYYTRDTSSRFYDWLNPTKIDSSIFKEPLANLMIETIKKNNATIKHFINPLVNTNWCSLFQFNNDYCLYGPSDLMENRPILITDSIYYVMSSDMELEIITDYQIKNNVTHEFSLLDYDGNSSFLLITIIDTNNGIAIWEYRDENYRTIDKSFKVKAQHVKQFPMIIYDCGNQKCNFGVTDYFDKPNFEGILK